MSPSDTDLALIRRAIELADTARARGDHPFGALLADPDGSVVLEAMNTVGTTGDRTGHAERNLMTEASLRFDAETLAGYSMYTSAEPCVMCSGAVYWTNVGRVVYGLGEDGLKELTGDDPENPTLSFPCRDVLVTGQHPTIVVGPVLADEAAVSHVGFWNPS